MIQSCRSRLSIIGNGSWTVMCPSAQPEIPGSVAFGVIAGTVERPHVAWIERPVPVTPELLSMTAPVSPTQVLRIAAPCQENACGHFDGVDCRLATRLVQLLPQVVESLPRCQIRPNCRWFLQEGSAACRVCPQVVTYCVDPSPEMDHAATPEPKH
jgi:hypothetical protein